MPIYEFECETCGADFEELFRTMAAPPRVACPQCGAKKVRRKLSLFGMSSRGESAVQPRRSGGTGCGSCRASSCAGCRR